MRLIDADRLSEVLHRNFGWTGGADTLQQLIDQTPTADAAPVVHGRWEYHDDPDGDWFDRCSVCGEVWGNKTGAPPDWKYCPACGAKMDKGDAGS